MAKVLKITRADKTNHIIPLENKAFWEGYNNRMPEINKVKLEVIDEVDAKDIPYIDENFVPGADAQEKLSAKDKEIAELKVKLAEATAGTKVSHETVTKNTVAPNLGNAGSKASNDDNDDEDAKTAKEVIALINEATTVAEVKALSHGDERKTVQDAAEKRLEVLKG